MPVKKWVSINLLPKIPIRKWFESNSDWIIAALKLKSLPPLSQTQIRLLLYLFGIYDAELFMLILILIQFSQHKLEQWHYFRQAYLEWFEIYVNSEGDANHFIDRLSIECKGEPEAIQNCFQCSLAFVVNSAIIINYYVS